jgi:hypothetical protein
MGAEDDSSVRYAWVGTVASTYGEVKVPVDVSTDSIIYIIHKYNNLHLYLAIRVSIVKGPSSVSSLLWNVFLWH